VVAIHDWVLCHRIICDLRRIHTLETWTGILQVKLSRKIRASQQHIICALMEVDPASEAQQEDPHIAAAQHV